MNHGKLIQRNPWAEVLQADSQQRIGVRVRDVCDLNRHTGCAAEDFRVAGFSEAADLLGTIPNAALLDLQHSLAFERTTLIQPCRSLSLCATMVAGLGPAIVVHLIAKYYAKRGGESPKQYGRRSPAAFFQGGTILDLNGNVLRADARLEDARWKLLAERVRYFARLSES